MRIGTPGFHPIKLTEARGARGLTQVALGELINRDKSNICKWELSSQLPENEALQALAIALNVPIAYFMQQPNNHGEYPLFYRSMASTTLSLRKRTQARLRWAQNISLTLQNWLDFPQVKLPKLNVDNYKSITDKDIEQIALDCRNLWGLGLGPISDVLLVLENSGIIVIKDDVGAVTMDGLSNWSSADNRPYILIAKDKDTCVRSRMDAAHELGHLVLHHSIKESTLKNSADFKEIERQAFYFAGCFLMPAESFCAEIWSPSLNTFLALKERWKVSIGAMIMRCANLNIVTDDYQKQMWKYYSSRGWRRGEPLDDTLISETPKLLGRSIKLLVDQGVLTRDQLLSELRLFSKDIEALTGLPTGYLNNQKADIINLPKIKKATLKQSTDTDNIIPFDRR